MNKHLAMAVKIARTSKCRYRHGCVVVQNGRVLSTATNRKVGDPESGWRRAHVHAEIAAINAAGKHAVSGSAVYVARVWADGSPAESKPCKRCEGFMERHGVSQVVWT
jgi:pyrimidine deaminase RibD-like protein